FDVAGLERLAIYSRNLTPLILCVDVIVIGCVGKGPKTVAIPDILPTTIGNAARIRRITNPGTVVLESAINVIRSVHVNTDVVELRYREVVAFPPAIAAIVRIPDAAIITSNHMVRVVRIDPDVVKVTMRST